MPISLDGTTGVNQGGVTGASVLPVGTTAQRPANSEAGMIRFNTDNNVIEGYDPAADEWRNINNIAGVVATGGTVTDIEQDGQLFRVHTFNSSGAFDLTRGGEVEYLVIAGGGAGGTQGTGNTSIGGSGGGAGGFLEGSILASIGSNTVIVGSGGVGVAQSISGVANNGENSSVFNDIALGGGGGAHRNPGQSGASGGSGGGSGFSGFAGGTGLQPTSSSGGFGNRGGIGATAANQRQGGGGGAAGNGLSGGTAGSSGFGGAGKSSAITGSEIFYAGGGGSGADSNAPSRVVSGGSGGGGAGGRTGLLAGENGAPNTGGGAGGTIARSAASVSANASSGGSGVVVIRYRIG